MKKRNLRIIIALLLLTGSVTIFLLPGKSVITRVIDKQITQYSNGAVTSPIPSDRTPASSYGLSESVDAKRNEEYVKKDDVRDMFRADERDNLVLNEGTRLNIEKLYALNTKEELELKLNTLSSALPPTAYSQLVHLLEYFDQYTIASKQIYPPDATLASPEDALRQLDDLHALRVKYFGADAASLFFSEEEKSNRQLVEIYTQAGRWHDENAEALEAALG